MKEIITYKGNAFVMALKMGSFFEVIGTLVIPLLLACKYIRSLTVVVLYGVFVSMVVSCSHTCKMFCG